MKDDDMDDRSRADVIVVGGGISGLTCAFWLAREGLDVRLLERDAVPGGCIRTLREGGWVFDQGPNTLGFTEGDVARLCEAAGSRRRGEGALRARPAARERGGGRAHADPLLAARPGDDAAPVASRQGAGAAGAVHSSHRRRRGRVGGRIRSPAPGAGGPGGTRLPLRVRRRGRRSGVPLTALG